MGMYLVVLIDERQCKCGGVNLVVLMVEERHWKCGGGGKPIGT